MSGSDDMVAHGSHDQFAVVDDNGSLHLEDSVSGRDGSQTHAGVHLVQFDDGVGLLAPTGTAEDVARLYLAALQRAPDVDGLEFWTNSIDNSHVPLAAVASSFAASPEFIHLYSSLSDAAFVQQLYLNTLGRPEDAAGAQFWNQELASGASRGQVLIGFAESPEHRTKTLPTAGDKHDAEAYRLYQAAFNRAPDQAGQTFWSSTLANGATLAQVAQNFLDSPEFQQEFGGSDDSAFVSAMYQNVLHRTGDAGGQQFWTNALQHGSSRADVLVSFSDSLENRTQTAHATHDGWVFIHA